MNKTTDKSTAILQLIRGRRRKCFTDAFRSLLGYVSAEGFVFQVVSGHGVSPGPGAAANIAVLANAALTFEEIRISKLSEDLVGSINLGEGILSNIAAGEW